MAQILIRKLDEETKRRLRDRAARHGNSMEAEAREILRTAVRDEPEATEKERGGPVDLVGGEMRDGPEAKEKGMGTRLWELFAPLGGIDLSEVLDRVRRDPPEFEK